ncbi:MAG: nucleotidyltransferase domain-containing protein [Pirellulaceae bacterium]|nr:nucleotidyltransferase domain-containing protein [Pirellulaceae bacterium]
MADKSCVQGPLVYSAGTQVVVLQPVTAGGTRVAHPAGAVGVIVKSPVDRQHAYRVRFTDGVEVSLQHEQLVRLADYKDAGTGAAYLQLPHEQLFDRVILRVVIGSQAYGLMGESSDIDRRGIYLPPAELHWSLAGVPEQIENEAAQEAYWELQKFLVLALKANPNVLECLYSPLVETATPLAHEILAMREAFLSQLVYQTYNGYVMSQFKKMQADIRNHGQVKWKHVMHLIRLLLAGIETLRTGVVPVHVGAHRDALLAIRAGQMPWDEVESWRRSLHREFDDAYNTTSLPPKPDYARASALLVRARQLATGAELP